MLLIDIKETNKEVPKHFIKDYYGVVLDRPDGDIAVIIFDPNHTGRYTLFAHDAVSTQVLRKDDVTLENLAATYSANILKILKDASDITVIVELRNVN